MVYITCFTLKEKKHSCSIFTVFLYGYLSAAMFIFFFADFLTVFFEKALGNFFVTKCSILDVAGILDPPQYAPTWITYTNNLIQVLDKR